MDNKMLNTEYDFKLADGSTVKLTLSFYNLLQLRGRRIDLYKRYNKIMQSSNKNDFDILDMVTVVYVGYVCANIDSESLHSEEEFIKLCGSDMHAIGRAVKALTAPKN